MPRKPSTRAAAQPPEEKQETVADLPAERISREGDEELKGGITSRYIGETEKNLGQTLDRAKQSDAMLFFDESDELFEK